MATGSQSKGAKTRVLKESKFNKKEVNKASGNKKTAKENNVTLASAFSAEKIAGNTEDVARSADYYRYGVPGSSPGDLASLPRGLLSFTHDEQEASIRIISEDTQRDMIPAYTKFLIESVQESHAERHQIVETFGDSYLFLFGERTPIYNFGGTLINSKNANWVSDFMLMYERYLRGTRCAEQKARALITYGGRQVEGFLINTANQTAASSQEGVGFSFQVVVTSRKLLGVSSDFGWETKGQTTAAAKTMQDLVAKIGGAGIKGSSNSVASDANMGASEAITGVMNPSSVSFS